MIQFGREFEGDPSLGNLKWWWPAKFRSRGGKVIPYADLDLTRSNPLIRHIVLGPSVDKHRGKSAVELCCEMAGLRDTQVSSSNIPFTP